MLCLMVQSDKMKRKQILIPVNPGGGGGGAGPPEIENRCEGYRCEGSQVRCDCVAWLPGCKYRGPGRVPAGYQVIAQLSLLHISITFLSYLGMEGVVVLQILEAVGVQGVGVEVGQHSVAPVTMY